MEGLSDEWCRLSDALDAFGQQLSRDEKSWFAEKRAVLAGVGDFTKASALEKRLEALEIEIRAARTHKPADDDPEPPPWQDTSA